MQDPIRLICDDELERRWVWISLIMAFAIGGLLGLFAVTNNLHPPSNVETIDSSRLHLTEEFAEDNLGVKENADGSPRFDDHALGCSICVDITQDTIRLLNQDKSVPEILAFVDQTYSRFGPSNLP